VVAQQEQPDVTETAVADISERRARKEAIRSENTERKSSDRNEQRAPERGDTRPQRDNSRPARHRHQEDNDTTGADTLMRLSNAVTNTV